MQSQSIKLIPKKLPKFSSSFNRQLSTSLIQFSNSTQGSIFDQYKKYQTNNDTEETDKKEDYNAGTLLPSKAFQVANVLFKQQGLSSSSVEDFKQVMDLATKLLPIKENENKNINAAEVEKQILELCGGHSETLYKFGNIALQLVRLTGNTLGSSTALKMYEMSYKNGHQNAQYTYANLLHDGFKGIERNVELSQTMMRELADSGNPLALTKYATWMIEANDFPTAIKYLEKGSEAGWAQASIHLGHLYRLGNGVNQDIDMAISYYQRAIDQKEIAQSHFYLGRCYAIHPTPNHKMSFKHYRIAAKQGLPEAQYNVGFCYNSGLGTKKDFTLAAEYYQMASLQKFTLAMINLAKLCLNGGGEEDPNFQKDPWKGVHLLKEAVKSKGPLGEDAQSILDSIDFDSLPKQSNKDGKCSIM